MTTIYSQRDTKWKDIKLGTSDVTIGNFGCTLTCFSMMVGKTPDTVNKLFIDNGVYASGNLIIWSNVHEALPELTLVERGWTYDNNKVKAWLDKGCPVIVEVDAAPIGSPRTSHFVLYIGNQVLADPWTGTTKPTSSYPEPKGFALYTINSSTNEPMDDYKKMYKDEKKAHDIDNKNKDTEIDNLRKTIATQQVALDGHVADCDLKCQQAKEETTKHLLIDFANKENLLRDKIKELESQGSSTPPAIEKPLELRYKGSSVLSKLEACLTIWRA